MLSRQSKLVSPFFLICCIDCFTTESLDPPKKTQTKNLKKLKSNKHRHKQTNKHKHLYDLFVEEQNIWCNVVVVFSSCFFGLSKSILFAYLHRLSGHRVHFHRTGRAEAYQTSGRRKSHNSGKHINLDDPENDLTVWHRRKWTRRPCVRMSGSVWKVTTLGTGFIELDVHLIPGEVISLQWIVFPNCSVCSTHFNRLQALLNFLLR